MGGDGTVAAQRPEFKSGSSDTLSVHLAYRVYWRKFRAHFESANTVFTVRSIFIFIPIAYKVD